MFEELKSVTPTRDYSKPSKYLEQRIQEVKSKYPHRFLQDHELRDRRFYDMPSSIVPMAGFVRVRDEN